MPDEGHCPGGPLQGRRSTCRDHDRFAGLEEDPAARSVDGLGDAGGMLQLYGSKPFDRRFPRESLTISSESREHPRWVLRLRGVHVHGLNVIVVHVRILRSIGRPESASRTAMAHGGSRSMYTVALPFSV